MKKADFQAWSGKTLRLNANSDLQIGDHVIDLYGDKGVVVKIEPATLDYHGTIFVWQSERTNHGNDNCEHYPFTNWKALLRRSSPK